jgi:5-methylcytosine-specific restriction endonuclease McrA
MKNRQVSNFKGKKHTIESKLKISQSGIGKHYHDAKWRLDNSKLHKGKIVSKESIEKMRLKILDQYQNGRKPWNFGRIGVQKQSEKTKQKLREMIKYNPMWKYWKGKKQPEYANKKRSDSESLDKHWNWLGGKSFEPYGIKFNRRLRERIRVRDSYCCQMCGMKQQNYRLMVHHIDYNKQNNDINNLISLCRECHLKTNFDREAWIKYFYKNKNRSKGLL